MYIYICTHIWLEYWYQYHTNILLFMFHNMSPTFFIKVLISHLMDISLIEKMSNQSCSLSFTDIWKVCTTRNIIPRFCWHAKVGTCFHCRVWFSGTPLRKSSSFSTVLPPVVIYEINPHMTVRDNKFWNRLFLRLDEK